MIRADTDLQPDLDAGPEATAPPRRPRGAREMLTLSNPLRQLCAHSIEIRLLDGSDRPEEVITIPRSPQTFRRKREIIQPSSELASGARPIRAEARRKLLAAIAKGRRWLDEMITGKVEGIEAIATREGVSE